MENESKNIYQAIAAAMCDITPILKRKKNDEQSFNYRGIDDVMNSIQPILKKHKIFAAPEVLEITREKYNQGGILLLSSIVKMRYTFYTSDGSSVPVSVAGEAMDTGDKSLTKAESIAYKIALSELFCIPTDRAAVIDPDGDSYKPSPNVPASGGNQQHGRPPKTRSNWAILKDAIKNTKIPITEIEATAKQKYGTNRLNNLSAAQVDELLLMIKEKIAGGGADIKE